MVHWTLNVPGVPVFPPWANLYTTVIPKFPHISSNFFVFFFLGLSGHIFFPKHVTFWQAMIYQMSPFFEVYARESCDASTLTVGFIFAAMPASSFLGNLAMDGMIRRFGVDVMMNFGLILLAGSSLGFGLSKSVLGWVCWRAVQGLATAPIYTSISTCLARTFTGEGEFHRVCGLQEVCGNVARLRFAHRTIDALTVWYDTVLTKYF